jgi:O-antigen/teichoic acid export membrane protein
VPDATEPAATAAPAAGGRTAVTTRMGRSSLLNLVGALTSQLSLFVVFTVLARSGATEVGRYTTCYAVLSLLTLLSMAGLRAGLTRYVAVALADADLGRLRGTLRLGLGVTGLVAAAAGAGLALATPAVVGVMDDPALRRGLLVVAVTVPALTLTEALLSATQGWRTQRPFTLVGRIGEPVARCLLGVGVLAAGGDFVDALAVGAVTAWVAAGAAAWWLLRLVRRSRRGLEPAPTRYEPGAMLQFSAVSWVSSLAANGLIWAGTLLLGVLATQDDVGTFSVATRLVTLAVFVMAPVNAAFTPHMAHLHHRGERAQAQEAYGSATRWIVTLSAPAFVMLLVLAPQLLAFFGPSYPAAAAVTVVLALGQLVSAAAGPCGTVLTMSGRVVLSMVDNIGALALHVALTLLLVPVTGVLGAAIAWSTALVLVNLAKLAQVRRLGLVPRGAGWGRVALAALPALAVALVVRALTDGWVPAAFVGGPLVLLAFGGALLLLGVPEQDRALARSVLGRGRRRRPAGRPAG